MLLFLNIHTHHTTFIYLVFIYIVNPIFDGTSGHTESNLQVLTSMQGIVFMHLQLFRLVYFHRVLLLFHECLRRHPNTLLMSVFLDNYIQFDKVFHFVML